VMIMSKVQETKVRGSSAKICLRDASLLLGVASFVISWDGKACWPLSSAARAALAGPRCAGDGRLPGSPRLHDEVTM